MPSKPLTKEKCLRLLEKPLYGRLATSSNDNQPYISPVNHVVYQEKIYFHTGFKGKKINNLRINPKVCFEVSSSGKLYIGPRARDFSMRFWSVLVLGIAHEIEEPEFKLRIMSLLMKKYAGTFNYEPLTLTDMDDVNIVEITPNKISGKVSFDPK